MTDHPDIPNLADYASGPPGDGPVLVMPDNFIGPHKMPVAAEVTGCYDPNGTWWIMYRIETVHGSFVFFVTPETALVIETETRKSREAQSSTPFIPPPLPGV